MFLCFQLLGMVVNVEYQGYACLLTTVQRLFDQRLLPSTTDAVQQYQQQGGRLTDPWKDSLDGNAYKYGVRQEAFLEKYPSFQDIFSKLVNGDQTTFKHALKFNIDITHRISST